MKTTSSAARDKGFRAVACPPPRVRLVDRLEVDVDGLLVRLSRREAHCRLLLGRLAAAFRKIDGHHRLGFARLGDWSRERLGLSGREIQSLSSVAARLEALPSIAFAFSRGELSWSKARLLCGAAEPGSEDEWLARSRGCTVRNLVDEIRRSKAALPEALSEAIDDETDSIEGEEIVRFRIRCPGRVVSLWRRTVELARRVLGSQAPSWKAAEAIAAEGASAVSVDDPAPQPPRGASTVKSLVAHRALPFTPIDVEPEDLDESEAHEALDLLDAFDLDERMRTVVRSRQEIDARSGRLLRRLLESRLHRALGFESFDLYVRERLGMSPSRARALVAIERKSERAPGLREAYGSGELSWVRALTVLPVVSGSSEREWITRAAEVTVRRLADEVEWALEARGGGGDSAPPAPGARLVFPDLQTCARSDGEIADREVTFSGPASMVAIFRAAIAAFTRPDEASWRGFARLLLHAAAEWLSQPRHRDPIFERDGWRCGVPACSSRRNLHDHHYVYRSRGGTNERENRGAECAWHHLRGIHGGLVRARGRAPDDIIWELGLRPGRAALLVLHGERYVTQVFDN